MFFENNKQLVNESSKYTNQSQRKFISPIVSSVTSSNKKMGNKNEKEYPTPNIQNSLKNASNFNNVQGNNFQNIQNSSVGFQINGKSIQQ